MELKEGMFVRTKYGINKIETDLTKFEGLNHEMVELEKDYIDDEYDLRFGIDKKDIIKASFDIIDLIEEHDFVRMEDRGCRFYEIEKDYTGELSLRDIGWDEYEELDETNISEIVAIVTHEQMERMKYEVK